MPRPRRKARTRAPRNLSYRQAEDRIHRIGQTRPVHVYNLCAANTAEHHILDVLDRRINMFELVKEYRDYV